MTGGARLLIFGAGRMGLQLARLARERGQEVVAVVARRQPDATELEPWYATPDLVEQSVDAAIDFSLPGGTACIAGWCEERRIPLVSGTTALSREDEAALNSAARCTAVLWSANFSLGVNTVLTWLEQASSWLPTTLGVEILDIHHAQKKDAPSGTALALGAAIGGEPVFESRREGAVIGTHRVRIGWPGETIEIVHRADDRAIYARGALDAAAWLAGQSPGRYDCMDWLQSIAAQN